MKTMTAVLLAAWTGITTFSHRAVDRIWQEKAGIILAAPKKVLLRGKPRRIIRDRAERSDTARSHPGGGIPTPAPSQSFDGSLDTPLSSELSPAPLSDSEDAGEKQADTVKGRNWDPTLTAYPGLRLERGMEPVPAYRIRFSNILTVDPSKFRIRTVSARKALGKSFATVPELLAAVPGAVAAINAGFFEGGGKIFSGFYVEDGELMPHHGKQQTVFHVARDGSVGVSQARRLDPDKLVSAVAGYSSGSTQDPTARSAACILEGGLVKLVAAYPVGSLDLMTRYLREAEGCREYVHLDGGGSTQFVFLKGRELSVGWERKASCYADDSGNSPARCFRKVADALVVVPINGEE